MDQTLALGTRLRSTARSAVQPIPMTYILSASHSGSTLLAMQLARHPGVCTVGELSDTPMRSQAGYKCSCGEELAACGFWQRVSAAMARRGFSYSPTRAGTNIIAAGHPYVRRVLKPLHRGPFFERVRDAALLVSPAARAHVREQQRLKAALAECVLECSGDGALIDTSKAGVQLKFHRRNPRFMTKAVWLVRDGRGVSSSLMKNEQMSMRDAAHEWRRSNEEAIAAVGAMAPADWMKVQYEDFCTDPDGTLQGIWRFMGAQPRESERRSSAEFHVLGHDRSRMSGEQKIRLNEKWRTELSAKDLATFDEIAGRLNRKLGYR
jgi:hypothetical protein